MANAKKIILVALEEELPKSTLPWFHIEYTGVGKINASLKTAEVIQKFSPELIINYGTAGGLAKNLHGLVEVSHFLQRDMDARALGFSLGQTPFDPVLTISFGRTGHSCGTGDSFVTQTPGVETDVVDMEAYAIAKACFLKRIDFVCYKFISDGANAEASLDWTENVNKGRRLFKEKVLSFIANT
ncbi:MAG: 5'-methylthioadenosine/S-adenosylhomocysteine nucleosidase [Paracoccaceae bacterium]|jgi:adenosylhomocysteine nucleosidase|nr:5'-methylthioadenosine/S-adenosylhomocysteine nucleosidase [Paracoccaceae bacterium]